MNERIIAPSILSADFTKLGEQVRECEEAGAKYLHIDVMDGIFVPSISIGFPVIETLRPASKCVFDVHLMITDPLRYIDRFAKAGADIITFHQEAAFDCDAVIEAIRKAGCKVGMTVRPHTGISALEPYLDRLDMVLLMTVEPGFGGQKYIESSTEKIREMRRRINESGRDIDLEVDGGVKLENAKMIADAGANILVAGSAVFAGDVGGNVRAMLQCVNEGVSTGAGVSTGTVLYDTFSLHILSTWDTL